MNKALIITKLKKIKPILKDKFKIEKIALFGSYARDTNNEKSDIDLLIELQENNKLNYFELENLRNLLEKELDNKIDIVDKKYLNPIIGFYAQKDMIYV